MCVAVDDVEGRHRCLCRNFRIEHRAALPGGQTEAKIHEAIGFSLFCSDDRQGAVYATGLIHRVEDSLVSLFPTIPSSMA
jgi:hypothetical protein